MIDGGRAAVDNARAGGDSSLVDTPIEPSALASPASFPASGIPFHGVYGFPGALRVAAPGRIVARVAVAAVVRAVRAARGLRARHQWLVHGKAIGPWRRCDIEVAARLGVSPHIALFEPVPAVVARLSLEKLRKVKRCARSVGWSWIPGRPWSRADFACAVGLHGGAGSHQIALFEQVAA